MSTYYQRVGKILSTSYVNPLVPHVTTTITQAKKGFGSTKIPASLSNTRNMDVLLDLAGNHFMRTIFSDIQFAVDEHYMDLKFCATIAYVLCKHFLSYETLTRAPTAFIEEIQRVFRSMRGVLIDCLIEFAQEYGLVTDTLYLMIDYIDQCLSSNATNHQRLQFLRLACIIIAVKIVKSHPSQVEFSGITDYTFANKKVLEMLNYSKFGMTGPTTECFVRLFICATHVMSKAKEGYATKFCSTNVLPVLLPKKLSLMVPSMPPFPEIAVVVPKPLLPAVVRAALSKMDVCFSSSDADSVSMGDSMPTCESLKSLEFEYLDESDVATLSSIQGKTYESSIIDDHVDITWSLCKCLSPFQIDDILDIDDQYMDPQFGTTIAFDTYNCLRKSETSKQPSIDFIEKIQTEIDASMRGKLIDSIIRGVQDFKFVSDTLYSMVNYMDRYLSSNAIKKKQLKLLGGTCFMLAIKSEHLFPKDLLEFIHCYMYSYNEYSKEEVLEMEAKVWKSLKFEMSVTTTKCFLRCFVHVAKITSEVPSVELECMSNYVAEFSLLEYSMLQYAPSLIAASSLFLAKYILSPSQPPWNTTLQEYTQYQPCDLHDCVKALHQICLNTCFTAIKEKYSEPRYKSVAEKYCPDSIPLDYFHKICS